MRLSTKHNQNPWFAWHYNKTLTHGFQTLAIEREGSKCWAVLSTHIGNGDVLVWIFLWLSRLWVCDQLLLQIHLLLLHWGPWQEHGHQGRWTFPGKSSNANWQFPCKPNTWSLLDWLDLVCIKSYMLPVVRFWQNWHLICPKILARRGRRKTAEAFPTPGTLWGRSCKVVAESSKIFLSRVRGHISNGETAPLQASSDPTTLSLSPQPWIGWRSETSIYCTYFRRKSWKPIKVYQNPFILSKLPKPS